MHLRSRNSPLHEQCYNPTVPAMPERRKVNVTPTTPTIITIEACCCCGTCARQTAMLGGLAEFKRELIKARTSRPLACRSSAQGQAGRVSVQLADVRSCLGCFLTRSALASPYVVSDVGHWSAPAVMAALASVVHDRQGAAGYHQNRGEDNQ
jgi:hypothetical protein